MKIIAEKITNIDLLKKACEMTMDGQRSNITLDDIYRCEHSPLRTQLFWIEMHDIPSFVSVHFVRHKIGVEHFVKSLRNDRYGKGNETRYSPVNHGMLINAQSLLNMARKRLCKQASKETRNIMIAIKRAVYKVDPDLAKYMVKECEYRGGICHELKSCNELSEMFIN